jgi:hypothetical protein
MAIMAVGNFYESVFGALAVVSKASAQEERISNDGGSEAHG